MAEGGSGDFFQPTPIDCQKYQVVLEHEKDLFKNFEIDLIGALQKLTEEVTVTETQNGLSEINFSLAGLVVQGSANVYGKKVDLLHNLTLQMLDNMAANYKDLNYGAGAETSPNRSNHSEFKEIKLIDMNKDTTVPFLKSNLLKRQLLITSIPDCLKNLETCQKEGDNMQSKMGEDIGHPKDFSINRFTFDCVNIVLTHQISENMSGPNGNIPNNCLDTSDTDEEDDDHDTGIDPEQLVINDFNYLEDDLVGTLNNSNEKTNVSPLQNCKNNQLIVEAEVVGETVVKNKHIRAPVKCKPLTLLDPLEVQVKDEKRPGLRKRVCVNSYINAFESSHKFSKKRKSVDDTTSHAYQKIKTEPLCDDLQQTAHPENYSKTFLKSLHYHPLNPFAFKECKRIEDINKLKNQNVQTEAEQAVSNEDCNNTLVGENEEIPVNGENLENGYDSGPDTAAFDNGLSDNSEQEGEFDHINSSYRTMVHNLQEMKSQSNKFKMSTDLSKRVELWNSHVNAILEDEGTHNEFDANNYQAHILDCFDRQGQTINFQKVVCGKPKYDVGRYLVCSLFLANNLNLEIKCNPGKVSNDMGIKLLSKEIRADINKGIF